MFTYLSAYLFSNHVSDINPKGNQKRKKLITKLYALTSKTYYEQTITRGYVKYIITE